MTLQIALVLFSMRSSSASHCKTRFRAFLTLGSVSIAAKAIDEPNGDSDLHPLSGYQAGPYADGEYFGAAVRRRSRTDARSAWEPDRRRG